MKARAPPPPAPLPAPRHIFRNAAPDGGGASGTDAKENVLRPVVDLQLTLPQGSQTSVTEDGSKALMDLLVELCSRHHLNPALHTLELLSPEGRSLGFKPNAPLGSLDVARVLIKEKVWEERTVRRPAPKVPEKTVRLMVNYHGGQKAVVRVNPFVPLQALVPVVCDKCEFEPAHVLLLKDAVSRRELPLDRSLTELGIKELYVHNQSLVLQPQRASAPALNYSDSIRSSTTSLDRAEKKGLLGIFQFSRRKTKTDTTSVDMDDQITDTHSNGLSAASAVSGVEDRPSTLGQSQSVMNISRMSPKADAKKRRAPALPGAPPPAVGHAGYEGYEAGLGSESQQRKRKAPAPPPTPASISPDPDDTSSSASPTSDDPVTETPARGFFHNDAVQSNAASATAVTTQAAKRVPLDPATVNASPTPSSPTPSSSSSGGGGSSTAESLAVQDSSSELSRSLDDSDLDQAVSYCSTLSSGGGEASGSARVPSATESPGGGAAESEKEAGRRVATSAGIETESTPNMNLKVDDVENNRHSAMAWLHSMQSSAAGCRKAETPEEETASLGSSSGGSSLPDQGYAASEGTGEGEDSGAVSSPSDTQPTSPDGHLPLDGRSGERRRLGPEQRDNSSDSDEGCATWGSRHRHNDITPLAKSGRLKDGYEDDPELTAQLHQTLADFEADLADHVDLVSSKDTPYTRSTDSNEVPVSVVDMDVPVTAIDEVLEDYERHVVESETKMEPAGRKGPSVEPQNQNNNACTAADANKSSSSANAKRASQHRKSPENKSIADKTERKMPGTKMKETSAAEATGAKEQRATSAARPDGDVRKYGEGAEIKPDPAKSNAPPFHERKPVLPPTGRRSVSADRDEETRSVYQNNSGPNAAHGKITRNVTSRFGMKTFTVVPPKPAVAHAAAAGEPAVKLTVGAIKIDDQGNMVKGGGGARSKVGGSAEAGVDPAEGSPLLGKAKAFWSSNERQDRGKDVVDKAKESTDGLKATTLKSGNTEELKATHNSFYKHAERAQPKEIVREEATEPAREREEMEGKISVSKNVHQQPSAMPAFPPPLLPDLKRDLSFLKPSRRTSSQYMASAITKYTPKHQAHPSAKPNAIPNDARDSAASSSSTSQTVGFQRSGRSVKVNPQQSSQSTNKENDSASKSNAPDPKRSASYPELVGGGLGGRIGSTEGSSSTPETETAATANIQSGGPHAIAGNGGKQIRLRSPSPARSGPPQSSAKPPTGPETVSLTSSDATKASVRLTPVAAPARGATPTPAVTLFGPVQKFRPVISRSVEKDSSLHSSLMDAIQTGGARDRLKKITTSGVSSMNKASHGEEENERSALLAAIRAPSSSGRLRKTKSEASDELVKFRKLTSEMEGGTSTGTSPPVFTAPPPAPPPPPPPPPPHIIAPPPPPLVLPQAKLSAVLRPGANNPTNPASARDAMLEAIRSGSAAERLKKVAAPMKTLHVNGRLGTMRAAAAALPQ
ncbi:protein cordon-bleu isoform X2 [Clinocottus analis]